MSNPTKKSKVTESIGLRIKKSRKKISFTLLEFGKLFDVTATAVSGWESGRAAFSAEHLLKLGKYLNVDPAWLLTGRKELAPDWLGKNNGKISKEE